MSDYNILLIVASGKSSRFGGFPKAFCRIGDKTNAENTIYQAKKLYDKIYIGVSRAVFEEYSGKIRGCEMFSIVTGQGDAHSLLKCLTYIKNYEAKTNRITVCWGDAVFISSLPFEELLIGTGDAEVAVACALDEQPYAWFDIDERNGIESAHFAKDEGIITQGVHDQSLFCFDMNFALKYLDKYREFLGITNENDENMVDKNEMRLLKSFEYLHNAGYGRAKCVEITPGKVFSFNTQEELNAIKAKVEK